MYILISILKAPGPDNVQLLKTKQNKQKNKQTKNKNKTKKQDTFPICNHFNLVL